MASSSDTDAELAYVAATARGRVQGVGYRAFVVRSARRLGVTGSVRNARDGSVEVLAFAARATLEDLIQELERGPRASRVDAVLVNWRDTADVRDAPDRFRVIRRLTGLAGPGPSR